MLKRFSARGFKSLQDVSLDLHRLVVVFGPNAVGKSNLVDALSLFSRIGTERTLDDAFSTPLRGYAAEAFTLPATGLPGLLAQERATLCLEGDIGSAESERRVRDLRYRVQVSIRPSGGALSVSDEYLAELKSGGDLFGTPRIEREGEQLRVRRIKEAGRPLYERIGLHHSLVSNRQFSGERYAAFDRLRRELEGWRDYYLDPRGAMREAEPPREVSDIGSSGNWIAPFLFRLKADEPKHFAAVRRAVRSAIPSITDLDVKLDERHATLELEVRQDGIPYSARVMSEGTLRVIALCAIAVDPWPASLVAFEEPENGVHPRRIEVISDLLHRMARRESAQVIVTTHSPTLVASFYSADSSRRRRHHSPGGLSFGCRDRLS